jgi:SAM-dependent methyltransferase
MKPISSACSCAWTSRPKLSLPVRDHDRAGAAGLLWQQFGMGALTIDPLMKCIHRLSVSVEALAALGAALRLQRSNLEADSRVRVCLQEVLHAIDPQLAEGLGHRADYARHLVEAVFRQSADLLQNPERVPGWRHQDPAILQSQGQVSRLIIHGIDDLAAQRPELRAVLRGSGTFLDVGTGAGWLALEAARVWPRLRIVGIDIWEPALALARSNVAASDHGERIELRSRAVERLDERATYALACFPGPFISAETTREALERIHHALIPGGWLVFALWAPSGDPLEAAVAKLRIVRSGGHPWISTEIVDCLLAVGFVGIEALPPGVPGSPIAFVLSRRPR